VQNWLFATYLPQRTTTLLNQLRTATLFPSLAAPDFLQHGGTVPGGFALTMTGPVGAILHFTLDGSDPRLPGGGVNTTATTYSGAVPILQNRRVNARARNGVIWSALNSAFFTIDPSALRITEIMYRPASNPLAEFLELTNTGGGTLSLAGLRFTTGIDFAFDGAAITSLAPGARLLIVRDLAVFRAVYGNAHDAIIAGAFANLTALANNGDTLTLADGSGATLFSVTYGDGFPWPAEPDGGGASLVLKRPATSDPSLPENWRPSTLAGGNPGTSDQLPLALGADLLTYYFGSDQALRFVAGNPALVELNITSGADAAGHVIEFSPDLMTWSSLPSQILLTSRTTASGHETLGYTVTYPASAVRGYLRARVTAP
jgi:hypothetical protein